MNFPTRKTQALLFYLAIEGGQQPREHLASIFWPDSSAEHSYASLRNTLSRLQTTLRQAGNQSPSSCISVTNTTIGIAPGAPFTLDLHTLERAYTLANSERTSLPLPEGSHSLPLLQQASACQRGSFLAGFSLGDALAFDDWAAFQRENWHLRMSLVLDRLSEILLARGEFSDAAETAARWIALDRLNEAAYRRKMRIHFAFGERSKALEAYETCRAVLSSELGIEPEPDTDSLAERIRAQSARGSVLIRPSADQPRRLDTSVIFLGSLFAGRINQTRALVRSYERAASGQPQLVVLRGDAGIGKTRLAAKFLAWAQAQGAEHLHGDAFEGGSHFPFQPLVDAIRLRLESDKTFASLLDGVWLDSLSQLMPELRRPAPDQPQAPLEPGSLEAELNQSQLFEALVQVTLVLAKKAPLVLFVDDLQWADRATLDLLHYAIRRWHNGTAQPGGARALLLVTLRSEALQPVTQLQTAGGPPGLIQWLTRVEREITPVTLELEPLGQEETGQMLTELLSPPAPEFAQWLYEETRGHPYYLVETMKDLLERRVLRPKRQADGQWTFSVIASHTFDQTRRVPSTVHAVIRSRLNRLSLHAFSLLAGAAVLEQPLTFDHLLAIANINEDLALPALDELVSGRLLLESGKPGGSSEYAFVNAMLRDVVYTEAGEARRRLFHRRALEILEAEKEPAAALAHQARAAGLLQEAFRHSLAAGKEALRLSAAGEAVVHLEHALQLVQEGTLPEPPDRTTLRDLYRRLRRAYELDEQVEKAQAIELAGDQPG